MTWRGVRQKAVGRGLLFPHNAAEGYPLAARRTKKRSASIKP